MIFWEGLVLIMATFNRDIGELQYRKVVVESGSRRYVEIQLFFLIPPEGGLDLVTNRQGHKFGRFCRLHSFFHFVLMGSS